MLVCATELRGVITSYSIHYTKLYETPGVTLRHPTKVVQLLLDAGPAVVLADGARLQAQLIVAADGRDSQIRAMAGIGTKGWDYDQHAIVATITPQRHLV